MNVGVLLLNEFEFTSFRGKIIVVVGRYISECNEFTTFRTYLFITQLLFEFTLYLISVYSNIQFLIEIIQYEILIEIIQYEILIEIIQNAILFKVP